MRLAYKFLNKGTISASFIISGNTPDVNDSLKIIVSGSRRVSHISFNNKLEMPSWP